MPVSDPIRSTATVDVTPAPPFRARAPRLAAWTGTSIMVRHLPGGAVAASCLGLIAVGASESDALRDLAKLVKKQKKVSVTDTDPTPARFAVG